MKAFLLALVAAAVISVGWISFLNRVQEPVSAAFATTAVRL